MHPLRSNHSQHYHLVESIQSIKIEVSKDVAKEKGLAEGDQARVFNDRGELIGTVKILARSISMRGNG
ncbi:molybdopterin dinucleotide binding domain-containing protein [Geobacillus sp. AYS3]|uniref:molybdopterin dinucleotide binding domain-containing protein n=1 Tax=Geobacillus sp. AYS3 TaxID=2603623 RepID=UPI001E44C1D2|nr:MULTISPECIES: molybdopterin dinucleotide binding domain-containing protein [unclassified Geobacillus]